MKSKKKIILYVALGIAVALITTLCVWGFGEFDIFTKSSEDNESGVYHLEQWLCENGDVYASEFCIKKVVEKDYDIKISHEPNSIDVLITYKKYDKSGNDFTVIELELMGYTDDVSYISYNKETTYKIYGDIDSKIYTHNYPLSYNENSKFSISDFKNKENLVENTRLLINETIDKANELLAEKNVDLTMQDVCFEKF